MLTITEPEPLAKRAIGREPTKPAASDGLLTVADIEGKQTTIAPLLGELHDDITKMRRAGTVAPHVLARHEDAHRNLADAYRGLDDQRSLAVARDRERLARPEDSPVVSAAALQKSDRTLSPLEAFKAAMRADPDAYFAQSGTARPAPATGRQLAKSAGDSFAEQSGAVEQRAEALEKSEGLRPSQAYAKALAESGAYSGATAA